MGYTKIKSEQFENVSIDNFAGLVLVYKSFNKKTMETHESAIWCYGKEYEMESDTKEEMFRVWKQFIQASWITKYHEVVLKQDNGGISAKFRASTPARIEFVANGKSHSIDIEGSVWAKVGIVPTKKDMDCTMREYKKKLHKAAMASYQALSFTVDFKALNKFEEEEKKREMEAVQAKKAELEAAKVAREAKKAAKTTTKKSTKKAAKVA